MPPDGCSAHGDRPAARPDGDRRRAGRVRWPSTPAGINRRWYWCQMILPPADVDVPLTSARTTLTPMATPRAGPVTGRWSSG